MTTPKAAPSPDVQAGRGDLRVLYVVDRHDAPYRYRCLNPSLQLRADGIPCDILHLQDSRLDDLLPRYSVVVLFRLPWSRRVEAVTEAARRCGATLVFDIDDLVFDPGLAAAIPFLANAPKLRRLQYQVAGERLLRTFEACVAFLGATPALARAASARGKPAFVHPNLLHPHQVRASALIHGLRGRLQRRPLMAYMSGSITHNEDLAMISPVLARILSERKDVTLVIGGFLVPDECLSALADRIIRLPFQDWRVQPWALSLARVNLAPLAAVDEFTNGKSALKFFEAGVLGLPTVASPTEPFVEAITPDVDGYLASTPEQWYEAITACLDEQTARRVGDAARRTVLAEHTHAGHRYRLRDILASVNGRASQSYDRPLPIPADDPDPAARPSVPRRCWRLTKRVWAMVGVVRRAVRPGSLSRPDLCAPPIHVRYDHVEIDPADDRFVQAIEQTGSSSAEVYRDGRLLAVQVLGPTRPTSAWRFPERLKRQAGEDGRDWWWSCDNDPGIFSPALMIQPGRFTALLVEMAADSRQNDAIAQVFWNQRGDGGFREENSVTFPIVCDGRLHRYAVTLPGTAWPRGGPLIRALRFDPLNAPGYFRMVRITLVVGESATGAVLTDTERSEDGAFRRKIGVDIVVPIYNARRDVARCVESVLRHAAGDWRLVLVDDASTDAELVEFLRRIAADHPRVVLLRNERNGGFVVTANRGLRHAAGRDVALLNSDTIVTEGFLDKLIACAYADETTGIVTPFTNHGTICSIPNFCEDNELPRDLSVDEYARLVSHISLRRRPEIVTAVGFCMYVRAEVIEKIGYFDEEHFGRGFGEENDYCERAKAAGYRIRLGDDLFIAHTGKASFGGEGRELERVNSKTMDRLHPRYFADVAEFCARNPLRELQANVRYHLARRHRRRYPAMMFVLHSSVFAQPMGGTEHVVRDLVENLALPRALIVFPENEHVTVAEVHDGRVADALIYRFPVVRPAAFFERRNEAVERLFGRIIDDFDGGGAHLHHLIRWPIGLWRELHARNIPYVYTIHDYYCVCPSWNLLNRRTGRRCACPGDVGGDGGSGEAIRDCVAAQYDVLDMPAPKDVAALLREHRAEFGELLAHAESIIAPSQAAYDVVRRRYPSLSASASVIGHGYDRASNAGDQSRPDQSRPADQSRDRKGAVPLAAARGPENTGNRDATVDSATSNLRHLESESSAGTRGPDPSTLRVALLGQVAYPAKGADAYVELMDQTRSLPIEWHVFGDVEVYAYRRRLEGLRLGERLRLHGPYRREDIFGLLARNAIDVTLLLPTCEETFCFTLSESWLAGVPAIVSDVGALPERVRETGAGFVVGSTREALATLRRLATDRTELAARQTMAAGLHHLTRQENAERHRQAYGRLWDIAAIPRGDCEITEAERELFWVYHHSQKEPSPPDEATPTYHTSWWYPHYLRVKRFVPPTGRGWAKQAYLRVKESTRRDRPIGAESVSAAPSTGNDERPDRRGDIRPTVDLPEGRRKIP